MWPNFGNVVMWLKFVIFLKEVVITLILQGFDQKKRFFGA